MNYRWQETIKILIPGFYFIVYMGTKFLLINESFIIDNIDYLNKLAPYIIIIILFSAFIIGIIIEILSGDIEFYSYQFGLKRPSCILLMDKDKRFKITNITFLKQLLKLQQNKQITNKIAAECLQKAKESINIEQCQEFYYQSILYRNLTFSHFIVFIINLFFKQNCYISILNAIILIIFIKQWRKMNIIYVKNIFIEYSKKTIQNKKSPIKYDNNII